MPYFTEIVLFFYTQKTLGGGEQHLPAPLEFLENVTVKKEGTIPNINTRNYILKNKVYYSECSRAVSKNSLRGKFMKRLSYCSALARILVVFMFMIHIGCH
jgi:hypothetical protein